MENKKGKLSVLLNVFFTLSLGAIAVVSSLKFYQLRKEQIAPTAPKKAPAFEERNPDTKCTLTFKVIGLLTPTPTITIIPSATGTPPPGATLTPTPTPTLAPLPTNTPSPGATLAPTSQPTATNFPTSPPGVGGGVLPTDIPQPTEVVLPEAGFTLPSLGIGFAGVFAILISLLFIL